VVDEVFEGARRLEHDNLTRGNPNGLAGGRVNAGAPGTLPDREVPEAHQSNILTGNQRAMNQCEDGFQAGGSICSAQAHTVAQAFDDSSPRDPHGSTLTHSVESWFSD
jgi:hypothetical protein